MPYSIDELSIRSEAQKIKLSNDSENLVCDQVDCTPFAESTTLFIIDDLVQQEPITIF